MGKLSGATSGNALWARRQQTVAWLRKVARADANDAEEAASEALSVVIGDLAEIETAAKGSGADLGAEVFERMRVAASRELSRLRRTRGKAMSLDAPMSRDDDESSDFSAFVVSRTTHDAEVYCDAMRAVRLARRLPDVDAAMLMMLVDGLTADEMAIELHIPAGEVRVLRAKLVRLMQASMLRGAAA